MNLEARARELFDDGDDSLVRITVEGIAKFAREASQSAHADGVRDGLRQFRTLMVSGHGFSQDGPAILELDRLLAGGEFPPFARASAEPEPSFVAELPSEQDNAVAFVREQKRKHGNPFDDVPHDWAESIAREWYDNGAVVSNLATLLRDRLGGVVEALEKIARETPDWNANVAGLHARNALARLTEQKEGA